MKLVTSMLILTLLLSCTNKKKEQVKTTEIEESMTSKHQLKEIV